MVIASERSATYSRPATSFTLGEYGTDSLIHGSKKIAKTCCVLCIDPLSTWFSKFLFTHLQFRGRFLCSKLWEIHDDDPTGNGNLIAFKERFLKFLSRVRGSII